MEVAEPAVSGRRRECQTLRVPDGAVAQNVELRLQAVVGLAGSPFTDTITAVVVSAESGVLLRPATLTIERRRRRDAQPLVGFAGFAVDPEHRELHLHPATRRSSERNVEHVEIAIGRFGVFGIAAATRPEIEALYARVPTDLLARLEAELAMGLLEPGQSQAFRFNLDVVRVAAQSRGDAPAFVPPWLARIVQWETP